MALISSSAALRQDEQEGGGELDTDSDFSSVLPPPQDGRRVRRKGSTYEALKAKVMNNYETYAAGASRSLTKRSEFFVAGYHLSAPSEGGESPPSLTPPGSSSSPQPASLVQQAPLHAPTDDQTHTTRAMDEEECELMEPERGEEDCCSCRSSGPPSSCVEADVADKPDHILHPISEPLNNQQRGLGCSGCAPARAGQSQSAQRRRSGSTVALVGKRPRPLEQESHLRMPVGGKTAAQKEKESRGHPSDTDGEPIVRSKRPKKSASYSTSAPDHTYARFSRGSANVDAAPCGGRDDDCCPEINSRRASPLRGCENVTMSDEGCDEFPEVTSVPGFCLNWAHSRSWRGRQVEMISAEDTSKWHLASIVNVGPETVMNARC
eukprot:scaffold136908_cov31-Tisochrysis_lutea.AAC.2